MDSEEEKVLYLSRVGRDKIFKYGTYNMVQERAITQDHPFYERRDETPVKISYVPAGQSEPEQAAAAPPPPPPQESEPSASASEDDAAALAAQMISSNFKVGLSQEEVDALLNGMG